MTHALLSSDRRAFLARSAQLAWTGAAAPLAINLAAVGQAAAFDGQGYRALVCIWLNGGNDQDNTVVPFDTASYAAYNKARGGIALTQSALQATALSPATPLPGGRQYALHPALGSMASLFDRGRLAVMLNVGPLVQPTTRAQYNQFLRAGTSLPPKLFSHNDQMSIWQSSSPEGATVGWGGRFGDRALGANAAPQFTCISTSGNAVLLAGASTLQYQLTERGPVPIDCLRLGSYVTPAVRDALRTLMTRTPAGVLETEYNKIVARSIDAEVRVTAATGGVKLTTGFPGSNLGQQLKVVAQLIGARAALGNGRQVFMVTLGGFDTHGGLLGRHASLMAQLGPAMAAFHDATVELGVTDQVTTFTGSEFGRTLSANTDGSDHGWGSHHLLMGGAVRGKAFYGSAPPVSIGDNSAPEDQWHVGQGRLLPSTSLDQFVATLARWFGVESSELDALLPNLRNFGAAAGRADYPIDLGFMSR
jgi:uncharacterized protein (DUF1501 family)